MQRDKEIFSIEKINGFKKKLFSWVSRFSPSAFLDTHHDLFPGSLKYSTFECIAATGIIREITPLKDKIDHLALFHDETKDWLFGYLSYELKNELEKLSSKNPDFVNFPELHFFQPEYVFVLNGNELEIHYHAERKNTLEIQNVFKEICRAETESSPAEYSLDIQPRMTKQEYIDAVEKLRKHIKRGDIYEANLCQEFFCENAGIDPKTAFLELQRVSPSPFSCWYTSHNKFLLCSSPERFLAKTGDRIISQPIKGTAPRGKTQQEDEVLSNNLENDPKERSENIMITDLVRNDLSRTAVKGSVKVEELCGIYSFPHVHQMISTISSKFNKSNHWTEVLKTSFPMGSMTGAPKIRAMELIEMYEKSKRGLYSGSVGYVSPSGDFDFNVVIRSILYNNDTGYLSFQAGGAITWASVPGKEYDECMLKARGMLKVLNPSLLNLY